MQPEKYLTAKQVTELKKQLDEIEAWAGGLLDKCTRTRNFLRLATTNAPKPAKRPAALNLLKYPPNDGSAC